MEPQIVACDVFKTFPQEGLPGQEIFSADPTNEPRSKIFGKTAVAGISLSIKKGDRLGIIGPNGAGKSTLLRLIAGLTSPTSGTIDVTGKVTSIMTLGVGMREDLSGRENIYIDGELQNKARAEIEKVIDKIIDFSELGDFIDYPVRTYSTGMKARLAFSMITHIEPEILIIDEALSVGDATFSKKASARIQEICDKGKIVIIVAHSMGAITEMCNRCLWMENGHVVMDGIPAEVTHAYMKSVRLSDEKALLDKFKKSIGNRSLFDGWELNQVVIFNGRPSTQRNLIESGEPTSIKIQAIAPHVANSAYLRVKIVRLDGLLMFEEIFTTNNFRISPRLIGLEIKMDELALGNAVYMLEVSLEDGNQIKAINSNIFEVIALNPPTGGKPMLLYPINISTLAA